MPSCDEGMKLTRRQVIAGGVTTVAMSAAPGHHRSPPNWRRPLPPRPPVISTVALTVNGERRELSRHRTTLLDALREHLKLTGTKRAATTVNAAPVPCWSTVSASMPASAWRYSTRAMPSPPSRPRHPDDLHPMQPPSSSMMATSAGIARRGRSARRWRYWTRSSGCPQPCAGGCQRTAPCHQHGNARTHERQPLPLRCLFQHCRSDGRGRWRNLCREALMRAFSYERAKSPAEVQGRRRYRGREVPGRRDQSARPDEAGGRDASAPGRCADIGLDRIEPTDEGAAHRHAGHQYRTGLA